jgi:hypothetical protein
VSLSLAQLAAAAAFVGVLSAGVVWVAIGGGTIEGPTQLAPTAAAPGGAAARAVYLAGGRYTAVVGELEQMLAAGRETLASETLATIEESLATIDSAIEEVETALADDPGSALLRRLLANHQRTRLGVLQRAAAAVQAQT